MYRMGSNLSKIRNFKHRTPLGNKNFHAVRSRSGKTEKKGNSDLRGKINRPNQYSDRKNDVCHQRGRGSSQGFGNCIWKRSGRNIKYIKKFGIRPKISRKNSPLHANIKLHRGIQKNTKTIKPSGHPKRGQRAKIK